MCVCVCVCVCKGVGEGAFKLVLMFLNIIDQASLPGFVAGYLLELSLVVKSAVSCQGDDQIDTVPAGFLGNAPESMHVPSLSPVAAELGNGWDLGLPSGSKPR